MRALPALIVGPAKNVSIEDRRQVVYLTVVVLGFTLLSILVWLTFPLTYNQEPTFAHAAAEPVFWEIFTAILGFIWAYALIRIGRVRAGKYIVMACFAFFPVVATLLTLFSPVAAKDFTPEIYEGVLLYLVLPVMFASFFLSLRDAVIVLAAAVLYILFIENAVPNIPIKTLLETLQQVVGLSIILIVLTWQRDQVERDRRKRLEALNEDLRKSEHEAQEAKAVAQESNKLKTEFLAVTSHELKTPLNSIIGFTDIILNGLGVDGPDLSEDQRVLLERVRVKSKDLLCSINDILDMSRLEAQKVEVVLEPVSPSSAIEQCLQDAAPQLREKRLMLKSTVAPDFPDEVIGDVHLLSRILSNLLSNAIKFTEQGCIDVEARLPSPDQWQISITDTGVGIAPDKLETIFQPFRQVDSSTTRQYGGTGLGLAIARSNARLMGGDVIVRSEVGGGSTFTVMLPLIVAQEQIGEAVSAH